MMGQVLEGNELEGKLGDVGNYVVDITPMGQVNSSVNGAYEKKFFGIVKVGGVVSLNTEIDLVGGVILLASKSNNGIIKGLATKLGALTGRGVEVVP